MVSATPPWQHRPGAVAPGSGSRSESARSTGSSGSTGQIFLRRSGADADPLEQFEDDERSGLTLIGLVVLAAVAVAILGVAAQMLG